MPSSLNLQVPSGNMSSSDRLMWLRILTAAKLATLLERPKAPDASELDAKSWQIVLLLLSHALDTGTEWSTDHSSGSSLRNIVGWISNLVSQVFQDTLLQLTKQPPLRKAHPSPQGKTHGIYFFVEYAACTSCLNLVRMPLKQLLLPTGTTQIVIHLPPSSSCLAWRTSAQSCCSTLSPLPVGTQTEIITQVRTLCTCTYVHAPMHMHLCTCTYAHAPMHPMQMLHRRGRHRPVVVGNAGLSHHLFLFFCTPRGDHDHLQRLLHVNGVQPGPHQTRLGA